MSPAATLAMITAQRYSRAGLAHAAADHATALTGERWQMAFRPRNRRDAAPFTIEKV